MIPPIHTHVCTHTKIQLTDETVVSNPVGDGLLELMCWKLYAAKTSIRLAGTGSCTLSMIYHRGSAIVVAAPVMMSKLLRDKLLNDWPTGPHAATDWPSASHYIVDNGLSLEPIAHTWLSYFVELSTEHAIETYMTITDTKVVVQLTKGMAAIDWVMQDWRDMSAPDHILHMNLRNLKSELDSLKESNT